IWNWWQRRQTPATATGPMFRGPLMGGGPSASGGVGPSTADSRVVRIEPQDYDSFEQRLQEVQLAYGAEDLNALRQKVTPEMLSYFSEELAKNASRGLFNRIGEVKLLKGDLAEAWREGGTDYATVAMRFSLVDEMIERASGRLVEGDHNH